MKKLNHLTERLERVENRFGGRVTFAEIELIKALSESGNCLESRVKMIVEFWLVNNKELDGLGWLDRVEKGFPQERKAFETFIEIQCRLLKRKEFEGRDVMAELISPDVDERTAWEILNGFLLEAHCATQTECKQYMADLKKRGMDKTRHNTLSLRLRDAVYARDSSNEGC